MVMCCKAQICSGRHIEFETIRFLKRKIRERKNDTKIYLFQISLCARNINSSLVDWTSFCDHILFCFSLDILWSRPPVYCCDTREQNLVSVKIGLRSFDRGEQAKPEAEINGKCWLWSRSRVVGPSNCHRFTNKFIN